MTSGGITIVDYGCGNPASIRNMLKKLGIKAAITSEAEDILTSGRIIFPGVGAFDHGAARIREKGIAEDTIRVALTGIEPVRRVVQRDRNQSEFKLTFQIYRDRLLTPTNIRVGRGKLEKHRALLDEIAAEYGVQPRFILAIWGMETRYGAVKPTMPVVPAVATLAYDRRRSSYFRRELFQALLMIDQGLIPHSEMLGSWAGAMGQPQFLSLIHI